MTTAYPIRPIDADEFPAFHAVMEHAFNSSHPTDPEVRHELTIFEFDRSLAAFDGAEPVGTAGVLSFRMAVPGGAAAVAGVTAVSVRPSHRRRGILSGLMRRQLADIRDRGETVAALFASEPGIYGRYGYGVASAELDLRIRRGEGGLRNPPSVPGAAGTACAPRLRSVEPGDAVAALAAVYDGVFRRRPGMFARNDRWWDYILWDPEHQRSGRSPLRCVIAEDDAGPRGYALFSVRPEWGEHGIPAGELQVRELMATDPAAHAAIWGDVLTRDLVAEVRARMRPADEPLLYLLDDSRRARPHLLDGLWVRLVSLPGALARRRYACPVDVVIEVADDLFAENAGRWRLRTADPAAEADPGTEACPGTEAGPGGAGGAGGPDAAARPAAGLAAICERTTAPADVALPVRALGAAYLGGTRLGALAAAGQVTDLRPGALATLSAALAWDPAPWCPAGF
jgi:predicted acetyltransferase